jgi:Fe2+ transport system protein B
MGAVYAVGEEENEESLTLKDRLLHDPFFLSKTPVSPELVIKIGDKYYLKKDNATPVIQKSGKFYKPNTLVAYTLMVFVLLYIPCMAAFGVYVKEGGIKTALFVVGYTTAAAYLLSTLIYQGGRLLGLG